MTKAEIRTGIKQQRAAIEPAARQTADCRIRQQLSALTEVRNATHIVGYISDGSEPDLLPLLQALITAGKKIYLPRYNRSSAEYELVLMPAGEVVIPYLRNGKYGIMEPLPELPPAAVTAGALWLVPGVAFDGAGNRLGRGKGIYDRFLADDAYIAVGVFYQLQQVDRLPIEAHDRQLDIIVTEMGISRFTHKK